VCGFRGGGHYQVPMSADDSALLHRYARTRDEAAFAELVRRYLNLVYFAALRQVGGDAHRAEDVTQNVFTLLARKAASLTRHQTLAGWLHTTTRYAASEAMRAERRRLAREQEAHTMNELLAASASDPEWERLRPVIDEALNDLGDADREAVLLRFFANQSFAELGAKLNLSENTARMRVERALDKLHSLLAKRGVTSTAAALGVALANQAVATAPAGLAASVTGVALGGVAATGGTLASALAALHLMSTTKFAVGVAAVMAVAALGTAGHRFQAQREARASLARLQAESSALAARSRETAGRTDAAEQKVTELKQQIAAAEVKVAADAAAAKTAAAWDPVAEGRAIMRRHPEVAVALREAGEADASVRYVEGLKLAGLSPEQIAEARALLGRVVRWSFDLGGQKQRAFAAEDALPRTEVFLRLSAMAGPEGWRTFSAWTRTQFARDYGHEAATALCFTGTPLAAAQLNRLTEVIFAATPKDGMTGLAGDRIDWDAVEVQAKNILSPEQMPAWKNVLSLARARRDANLANQAVRELNPAK
jgi:RNA polymerase sigma factor (sigma-70 family)